MAASPHPVIKDFDVPAVATVLNEIQTGGRVDEGRQFVEDTLFRWNDAFSRAIEENPDLAAKQREEMEEAVVGLWLEYAQFEKRLRQFKQAVKVFESGTTDVIGERSPRLWAAYGHFCRERGKYANAKKVYLRALEVLPSDQCDFIWSEFLAAIREKGNVEIETVEQLKASLQQKPAEEEAQQQQQQQGEQQQREPQQQQQQPRAQAQHQEEPRGLADTGPVDSTSQGDASHADAKPSALREAEAHDAPPQQTRPMEVDEVAENRPDPNGASMDVDADVGLRKHEEGVATSQPDPGGHVSVPQVQPVEEVPPIPLPLLLFTYEPLTMDEVQGTGLDETAINQIKALMTEPTLFDVVEGQRLLQYMKEQLAVKIVGQMDDRHAGMVKELQHRHTEEDIAGLDMAAVQEQRMGEWERVLGLCGQEKRDLLSQIAAGLTELQAAQQTVLGQAEIPGMHVSSDATAIEYQRKVLRVISANLQLYRLQQKIERPTSASPVPQDTAQVPANHAAGGSEPTGGHADVGRKRSREPLYNHGHSSGGRQRESRSSLIKGLLHAFGHQ